LALIDAWAGQADRLPFMLGAEAGGTKWQLALPVGLRKRGFLDLTMLARVASFLPSELQRWEAT
jgi:hypothetical protein